MQTFLPYPEFIRSAQALDNKRLGKQRVECKQILRALGVQVGDTPIKKVGWRHHPAVLMWRGAEWALCLYAMVICREWRRRGFRDSLMPQFRQAKRGLPKSRPDWLGREDVHRSHRSNLLQKDPTHYGRFGWSEPPMLYVWPKGRHVPRVSCPTAK